MHIFKFDLKQGIVSKIYKYILLVFIIISVYILFIMSYNTKIMDINESFSISDLILYIFRGKHLDIKNNITEFPPIIYMVLQLFFLSLVGNYAFDDMSGSGKNVLLRVGSKSKWIISKVAWLMCSIIVGYFIIWGSAIITCLIHPQGMISLKLHSGIVNSVDMMKINIDRLREMTFFLYILPLVAQIALGMVQLCIQLFINPLIAFLFTLAIVILSPYYSNIFLLGNAFIMENNSCINGGEIDGGRLLLVCIMIIVVSFIAICKGFKYKDIL